MPEELTTQKPNWMDRLDTNLTATEQRWAKKVEEWCQRLDRFSDDIDKWAVGGENRMEEWKIRTEARLHLWRLDVAEMYPRFLANMSDLRANTQLSKEYGKAHDEFMKSLSGNVELALKYAKPEEKAEKARWVCATYIDEFEGKARHVEQRKAEQLLLTSRNIFNKGVSYSDQYDNDKIDTNWANAS